MKEVALDIQEGFDKEDSVEIDNSFLPSSIGITFYCKAKIKALNLSISTASYESIKNPYVETTTKTLETLQYYLLE